MIRKASNTDIDRLLEIAKACANHMISKGIFQWNEFYPSAEAFQNDLKREELFVLEIDTLIIGCITLSTFMDEEYEPIHWLTPNQNNLYVHRLAVHPKFQGQGFAQKLMDFAETYAKNQKFSSIRLDTFSQNKRNQTFYKRRNYKEVGSIFFPKQSEHPFTCYELVL